MTDSNRQSSPLWIIAAGVCALIAIGFAVWAFSLKSDRDDAQAKLKNASSADAQDRSTLSQEEQTAKTTEAKERAVGKRTLRRYRKVRGRFVKEEKNAGDLRSDIRRESGQLDQTRAAEKRAEGEDAQVQAQLRTADQKLDLAAACARGALTATDEFLNAKTARKGANRALTRLEGLQNQCTEVVQDAP